MFEEMVIGASQTVALIKLDQYRQSKMINSLMNVSISAVSAAIKEQDLMKEQALLHDPEKIPVIDKPTGCPQRIWDRASDSTKRVLIEAARSK